VTTDPAALAQADFIIIAVPTPVDSAHQPDLGPHERGVLVADPGPAVRLHHRPVEEGVRRLIEVEEDRDERARE